MKKPRIFLICMILSSLIPGNLLSQETAVIKIDFDRKIGAVNPNIYGAFVEPISIVVYGSIYDPSSSLADENGFRKDLIQLIRELKIPVVRWRGKIMCPAITGRMELVQRDSGEIKFKCNTIRYSFPAYSLTQLEISFK